jgi:hypothetical protein
MHANAYYFDWSTIEASSLNHHLEKFMIMNLTDQLNIAKPTPQKCDTDIRTIAAQNISTSKAANNLVIDMAGPDPVISPIDVLPVISRATNETAEHGQFVAKKYLWLMDSAMKRGHVFSLPIEELSTLLKKAVCFYTGTPLVHYPHDKRAENHEIPDNYMTLDRMDNNLGYISGNVVVCSKAINALKDQMSQKEFEQMVALKKIMEQSDFNPNQMRAFSQLMAMNG